MDNFVSRMMGTNTVAPRRPSPTPLPPTPTGGQPRLIRPINHQRGTTTGPRSQQYRALPPGLRVSKSGKTYHESRANRSYLQK